LTVSVWVLFKLGRNDEALAQLRRAVDLIKDDADPCAATLADVLLKVGKTEEALTVLHHASELEPGNKRFPKKLQKLKAISSRCTSFGRRDKPGSPKGCGAGNRGVIPQTKMLSGHRRLLLPGALPVSTPVESATALVVA